MFKLRRLALDLQDGLPLPGKPGNQELVKTHETVQSQAVAEFAGP